MEGRPLGAESLNPLPQVLNTQQQQLVSQPTTYSRISNFVADGGGGEPATTDLPINGYSSTVVDITMGQISHMVPLDGPKSHEGGMTYATSIHTLSSPTVTSHSHLTPSPTVSQGIFGRRFYNI